MARVFRNSVLQSIQKCLGYFFGNMNIPLSHQKNSFMDPNEFRMFSDDWPFKGKVCALQRTSSTATALRCPLSHPLLSFRDQTKNILHYSDDSPLCALLRTTSVIYLLVVHQKCEAGRIWKALLLDTPAAPLSSVREAHQSPAQNREPTPPTHPHTVPVWEKGLGGGGRSSQSQWALFYL